MRKTGTIAAMATLGLMLGACSSGGGYSRSEAIDELKEGGMTQQQAECIVDKAEDTFGINKLKSDDEPTAEEQQQIIEITTECMTGGE
jgi:hypothetical protein